MREVTDALLLADIRNMIRDAMPLYSTEVLYALNKAWFIVESKEVTDSWFMVIIADNMQRVYKGILHYQTGMLFLEIRYSMSLVDQRIENALHYYNAHSWPYRGV